MPEGHIMLAPLFPAHRTASPHRHIVRQGLLPTTLIALALTLMLAVMHLRAISAEALDVARIQAVRIGSVVAPGMGDERLRDLIGRALARSAPTHRVILHRDDLPDLVVDSGRRTPSTPWLSVRLNTPMGEMETFSDASALHERRLAAWLMTGLLGTGILFAFAFGARTIEREASAPLARLRERLDLALHPRDPRAGATTTDDAASLDDLLTELAGLRERQEAAMAEALRLRLHEIARHTRFLEQMGDHFRQPLQALSLFVAGMQPGDDLRQRAVQGQMQHNLARLGELLDGLLDMARFDAGAVEPEPVELLAADLFVRARAAIAPDAARLGVDVRWRGGALPLRGDPTLLGELLHRLLTSAVACAPQGRVLVAMRRRGADIRLEVRDNGIGIEPAQQERLFEAFTRLPGHPGFGLGLAVARRIADTLGGAIGVRSRPGRGTLYWVHLPGVAMGNARPARATLREPLQRR